MPRNILPLHNETPSRTRSSLRSTLDQPAIVESIFFFFSFFWRPIRNTSNSPETTTLRNKHRYRKGNCLSFSIIRKTLPLPRNFYTFIFVIFDIPTRSNTRTILLSASIVSCFLILLRFGENATP